LNAVLPNQNILSFSVLQRDINLLILGSNGNWISTIETGHFLFSKIDHPSNKSADYVPNFIPDVAIPN